MNNKTWFCTCRSNFSNKKTQLSLGFDRLGRNNLVSCLPALTRKLKWKSWPGKILTRIKTWSQTLYNHSIEKLMTRSSSESAPKTIWDRGWTRRQFYLSKGSSLTQRARSRGKKELWPNSNLESAPSAKLLSKWRTNRAFLSKKFLKSPTRALKPA